MMLVFQTTLISKRLYVEASGLHRSIDNYMRFTTHLKIFKINQALSKLGGKTGGTIFLAKIVGILSEASLLEAKSTEFVDRFKCSYGIEYATKSYPMARVPTVDCPTRAFISSSIINNGFFFPDNAISENI